MSRLKPIINNYDINTQRAIISRYAVDKKLALGVSWSQLHGIDPDYLECSIQTQDVLDANLLARYQDLLEITKQDHVLRDELAGCYELLVESLNTQHILEDLSWDVGSSQEHLTFFDNLPNSLKIMVLTIATIIIRDMCDSTIVVAYPETHLSPQVLAGFLTALSDLATRQQLDILIPTNSPFVVSHATKENILVIDVDGVISDKNPVQFETFYGDPSDLLEEVFMVRFTDTYMFKTLHNLASHAESYQQAIEECDNKLSRQGKIYLMALMANKES